MPWCCYNFAIRATNNVLTLTDCRQVVVHRVGMFALRDLVVGWVLLIPDPLWKMVSFRTFI